MAEGSGHHDARPIVLVLTDHYVPGFRHGGPIRSIRALVSRLGEEFDFRILTRDRDAGSAEPFARVRSGVWYRMDGCAVRYLSRRELAIDLWRLLRSTPHDVLYLNSYFSPMFTIVPLLLRRARVAPRAPLVIAPRGEFSEGALGIKSVKKRAWKALADALGLYRGAIWQATSPQEVSQIEGAVGHRARVLLGPIMPSAEPEEHDEDRLHHSSPKRPGAARLVFLSRITPMKNLSFAVSIASRQPVGQISLDIYGVIDDQSYWADCQRLIAAARDPRVVVTYRGEVPHERVGETLSQYDLLLLPSRGENFGHVIFEALASGCPVAISDRTPWHHVESEGAGWVIPLADERRWEQVIDRVVRADEDELERLREGARAVAGSQRDRESDTELNRRLFATAAAGGP
jgi:glycosyltransferase involved in cell wall biosynthesis